MFVNTVAPLLWSSLGTLMQAEVFNRFRLVGGTALSLQLGHRMSEDIDLFTDALYGSLDFDAIDNYLKNSFNYVDSIKIPIIGMGRSYYVGNSEDEGVKLDIYYTDDFINEPVLFDNIRMASLDEIAAMKIEVVQRVGRKKDFWDLHELLQTHSLDKMISLHEQRYPYGHDVELILKNFTNFEKADKEYDPDCLRGKYWEVIKQELTEALTEYQHNK